MNQLSKNSKLLLYGQALSFMGDYCVLPALLIISTYFQDYWITSGVIIVRSLPVVFQPFLGGIVDKYNRVKLMLYTDIIRGFAFLGVTFLPKGEYPLVFLTLLFISYGSGVLFNPARLAVMSSIGDDIKRINTLFAKATTLFIIFGAIFGAAFLYFGSIKLAVAFNALTYFVSAILISKMNITKEEEITHEKAIPDPSFNVGIKTIIKNPFVLNGVFTMITMSLLWGIIYSYFPLVSESLGKGEIGNFILTLCIGVGGFIGAQMVNIWGFKSNKGLIYFVLLSTISLSSFITSSNFTINIITAVVFFISMEYGEVLAKVRVQENSPNEIQGRIFSISEALIGISMSIGSTFINFIDTQIISFLIISIMLLLFLSTRLINKELLNN